MQNLPFLRVYMYTPHNRSCLNCFGLISAVSCAVYTVRDVQNYIALNITDVAVCLPCLRTAFVICLVYVTPAMYTPSNRVMHIEINIIGVPFLS